MITFLFDITETQQIQRSPILLLTQVVLSETKTRDGRRIYTSHTIVTVYNHKEEEIALTSHSGYKFTCAICNQTSYNDSSLYKHTQKMHKVS